MGQSNANSLREAELTKVYSIDSKDSENSLTYLTHKQSQLSYLLREMTYSSQVEAQEMAAKIEQRRQFRSGNITNLIRAQQFEEDNLCSKYQKIYALWDYPKMTLADDINMRSLQKTPFSPYELRSLIAQIAQGLGALQKHKISHESINIKTILLEQPFNVKIVDPIAVPLRPNLEVVYHSRSTKGIYLSPEHCRIIEEQEFSHLFNGNPFKEDVFTTGMVVLECALLQKLDECYLGEGEAVNWKKLDSLLTKFQSQYGLELRDILNLMLKKETNQRVDWLGLNQRLTREEYSRQGGLGNSKLDQSMRMSYLKNSPVRNQPLEPQLVTITEPIMRTSFIQTTFQPRQSFQFNPPAGSAHVNQTPVRVALQPSPQIYRQLKTANPVNPTILFKPQINKSPIRVSFNNSNHQPFTIANKTQLLVRKTTPSPPVTATDLSQLRSYPPLDSLEQVNSLEINLNTNERVYVMDEYQLGSRYEGYKFNGKRDGWGKFYFHDGGSYEGEWRDNLMSGKGELYYQSGQLAYEGCWERDQFHGLGKLYNQNTEKLSTKFDYTNFDQIEEYWVSYEGKFVDDVKEGHGKLLLSNGEIFEGNFSKDTVEGEGTYRTLDGRIIRGIWRENRLERELA